MSECRAKQRKSKKPCKKEGLPELDNHCVFHYLQMISSDEIEPANPIFKKNSLKKEGDQ